VTALYGSARDAAAGRDCRLDLLPRRAKPRTRLLPDPDVRVVGICRSNDRRQGAGRERLQTLAAREHLHGHMVALEGLQVASREGRRELWLKHQCIVPAEAKNDRGADVPENRVADGRSQLGQILVCQRQAQAEFSGLGQHGGQRVGDEVLELVDIDHERRSSSWLLHRRELNG